MGNQKEIIDLLIQKEYNQVWELVKAVGYKEVPSVYDRYLIFQAVVKRFNPRVNNNFIYFYLIFLRHSDLDSTFYITDNKQTIQELKKNHISPTGTETERIKELARWLNDSET